MNNKDAKKFLELDLVRQQKWLKTVDGLGSKTLTKVAKQRSLIYAYFISLAKELEQAKVGLPEEKEHRVKHTACRCICFPPSRECDCGASSFNACLHQVALSRVKFKDKVLTLLQKEGHLVDWGYRDSDVNSIDHSYYEREVERLADKILSEMGVSNG